MISLDEWHFHWQSATSYRVRRLVEFVRKINRALQAIAGSLGTQPKSIVAGVRVSRIKATRITGLPLRIAAAAVRIMCWKPGRQPVERRRRVARGVDFVLQIEILWDEKRPAIDDDRLSVRKSRPGSDHRNR